jgi:NAD(P)-dependent dehydrogenase (short-subunit alcohol dehydrogenase family)
MLRKFAESTLGDPARYPELLEKYPLKRPAKIHEITDLFLFLASFRSGYTSGTVITVDGGIASRRSVV